MNLDEASLFFQTCPLVFEKGTGDSCPFLVAPTIGVRSKKAPKIGVRSETAPKIAVLFKKAPSEGVFFK